MAKKKPITPAAKSLLKALILEHYGTQSALAKAIGCDRALVCRWLSGKQGVSVTMAIMIEILTDKRIRREDLCAAPYKR